MFKGVPRKILCKNQAYDFDIYIKIEDTYHLFAAKGTCLQENHLHMLKTRDTQIYVSEEEQELINKYVAEGTYTHIYARDIDSREKAHIMLDSAIRSIREVYKGILPQTITDVERNAGDLVKLIISDGNVMDNLGLINVSDHFTYQHSVRVGIYATALALKLFGENLTRNEITEMSMGFFLHDVGMIEVPKNIIEKSEKLSPEEWDIIRMHPVWGRNRLMKAECVSNEVIFIVLYHHERHDGSGYPYKLRGDHIPRCAKICAMADAFESLTSFRPYRKPTSPYNALRIMYQEMSKEFDLDLFTSFVNLLGPA